MIVVTQATRNENSKGSSRLRPSGVAIEKLIISISFLQRSKTVSNST
ncbi:hypothetical protein L902_29995 [Agrobacterium radiobacter DSM 30147]|nr:hypothetical protein L902_29995 [Agrobacterium radiobacter DSM 30147]